MVQDRAATDQRVAAVLQVDPARRGIEHLCPRNVHAATSHQFDQTLAHTRSMLDGESFERAWAEGQKMTIEYALEYAHGELVSREETP